MVTTIALGIVGLFAILYIIPIILLLIVYIFALIWGIIVVIWEQLTK